MSQQITLKSRTILGILGSGQLARMTAIAGSELGIEIRIFCSESGPSPAEHIASKTFKGDLNNKSDILRFAEDCDFLTLENEFIDPAILEAIDEKFPNRLFPTSKTFRMIGDKISEKENFIRAGLKIAPFCKVKTKVDISEFAKTHGYPVVLKTAKGGYDGYGNVTIKNEAEIAEKFPTLKGELLVEAFIPYEKELAVMVARNSSGEIVVYPIAHTMQDNHICHYVSIPAEVPHHIESEIKKCATLAMTSINAVGIFAFEFFLTRNEELYLNESAPRPHNSGHYTIEGTTTSQFHNHVRSVLNLPLGSAALRAPHIMMLNLLGSQNGPAELSNAHDFLKVEDGHLHLYGKKLSKPGRKMGHFTLMGEDKNKIFKTLLKLKSEYSL
ncbi:MAG: 5-(carboxyamino)imidazole ribonucleotide synthase [Bacteriovorax sp.]|jgi:5-(carboxyamino)imidazole ribonucleotide synthase